MITFLGSLLLCIGQNFCMNFIQVATVESSNKGHFGTNINSSGLSLL